MQYYSIYTDALLRAKELLSDYSIELEKISAGLSEIADELKGGGDIEENLQESIQRIIRNVRRRREDLYILYVAIDSVIKEYESKESNVFDYIGNDNWNDSIANILSIGPVYPIVRMVGEPMQSFKNSYFEKLVYDKNSDLSKLDISNYMLYGLGIDKNGLGKIDIKRLLNL